jgi:Integrase core domain
VDKFTGSGHLHLPRSTVQAVLGRYRMPLLRHLDQASGLPVRRPKPRRYEHPVPGDLVHVDIKKLGRIPDGGGHRKLGRTVGNRNNKKRGRGYAFVHHAVDDHSRLADSEILDDERKETAAAFWGRAQRFFADHGITVKRVLTDNGSCYRSTLFATTLGPGVAHKKTRPYRPQTNGKVERSTARLTRNGPMRYLFLRRSPRRDLPKLAASLQSSSTSQRHRRKSTYRTLTRSQPAREKQLAPRDGSALPLLQTKLCVVKRY